jgi:UDP-N-acetylglucosamine transferase subunit ALG13
LIFVTLGTHHQPFQRLLAALTQFNAEELVVQYGPGSPPAGVRRAEAYMPFDEMLRNFADADGVITHAGVGSIICAKRAGHVPLVVPRHHALGEHVDDHQAELTRRLEERGAVVAAWDIGNLRELVAVAVARRQPAGEMPEPPLCPSVRAALHGEPLPQPSAS